MIPFDDIRKRWLADPEVIKELEAQKLEFEIARALIEARIAAEMTQAEVAKKMHTSQSQVARIEGGSHYPSLRTIQKYAKAINHKICIEITP